MNLNFQREEASATAREPFAYPVESGDSLRYAGG